LNKYIELENQKGTIYIKETILEQIAKVDTIVFDCDGVLLDAVNAYNNTIAVTTRIIIKEFTGLVVPKKIFDRELYHAFKSTGGLNNDWAHTYALIMRILCELPAENLAELNKLTEDSLQFNSPKDRFDHIAGLIKSTMSNEGLYEKLAEFASKLDETGIEKVDKLLLLKVGVPIKKALKFWGDVGESIISTLFEEVYSGAELFSKAYGIKPQFIRKKIGMIEASEIVIQDKTLDNLESIIGGSRFGIASGSPRDTARYALKHITKRFPEKSQYWYDNISRDEERFGEKNLQKPNPYSLLKASEPYNPNKVLYIGDTMADYLTAENAGKDFIFAGVYTTAYSSESVRNSFLEIGCEIIAPTVNEIPQILRYARRETI
jgi:phosphoglycolate phosphatase-like HAD superfamily hydrolase